MVGPSRAGACQAAVWVGSRTDDDHQAKPTPAVARRPAPRRTNPPRPSPARHHRRRSATSPSRPKPPTSSSSSSPPATNEHRSSSPATNPSAAGAKSSATPSLTEPEAGASTGRVGATRPSPRPGRVGSLRPECPVPAAPVGAQSAPKPANGPGCPPRPPGRRRCCPRDPGHRLGRRARSRPHGHPGGGPLRRCPRRRALPPRLPRPVPPPR